MRFLSMILAVLLLSVPLAAQEENGDLAIPAFEVDPGYPADQTLTEDDDLTGDESAALQLHTLAIENAELRRRVADLEAMLIRAERQRIIEDILGRRGLAPEDYSIDMESGRIVPNGP